MGKYLIAIFIFLGSLLTAAPQYGSWGYDETGRDIAVAPGDDFFRYANGAWVSSTQIPPTRASSSVWTMMKEVVDERLHTLLEKLSPASQTVEGKVGAFYRSFMNEAEIEKLGSQPIAGDLEAICQAKTHEEIAYLMGKTYTSFFGSIFNFVIKVDRKQPTRYVLYLGQGGLGLPEKDYYLLESFAKHRQEYEAYIQTLLTLIDWPNASQRAKELLAFETAIAQVSWSRTRSRDLAATYNPMTLQELTDAAPGFAFGAFLKGADLAGLSELVVAERDASLQIAALFANTPIDILQAYLAFTVADNASSYLSSPFVKARFEMRSKTLTGRTQDTMRWERALVAVGGGDFLNSGRFGRLGNLAWAVGELYTDRYFPKAIKEKIESLVDTIKRAFRLRILQLDWMSPETKLEAIKKLDSYIINIGYPEKRLDYSSVVMLEEDLVGNVRRAAAFDWALIVAQLNGPVDRTKWSMTPHTVNAYNNSVRNIGFPAAILQPPMFDPEADSAVNYGAIGAIIGHELTHGLDDQGRKIDASGMLLDWWSEADAASFEARASELGAQFSSYEPLSGLFVNGKLTMGENIADLGGLSVALDAYHASLGGTPAPTIDGLTGDQRLFLGYAQAFRSTLREEALRRKVVSDPHSPDIYRINGIVRNLDAWYEAFGVTEQNSLYLAPEARVRIW